MYSVFVQTPKKKELGVCGTKHSREENGQLFASLFVFVAPFYEELERKMEGKQFYFNFFWLRRLSQITSFKDMFIIINILPN